MIDQLGHPDWQHIHFASSLSAPQALADACSGKARGVVLVAL